MELIKRLLVASFFIPAILLIFYMGDIALISFLALVVFVQMYELREIFLKKGVEMSLIIIPLSVLVFAAVIFYSFPQIIAALLLVFILVMGKDLISGRSNGSLNRIAATIFSIIYTAFFLATIYKIRILDNGVFLILSLISLIWLTDSAAYFTGRTIGKHREIFKASPNKSLEGYFAGILMTIIGAFIAARIFDFSTLQTISLIVSVGIFGQFGDLFESMLKRDAGIKDSSSILPGHGGVLDRFDSLQIAAPIFYLLLVFFK
jgi:phosphatidate cytidylyltransferase